MTSSRRGERTAQARRRRRLLAPRSRALLRSPPPHPEARALTLQGDQQRGSTQPQRVCAHGAASGVRWWFAGARAIPNRGVSVRSVVERACAIRRGWEEP